MCDTKENMEKRMVSLASSGVIGYYIFSKLNATQDAVDVPDDGLQLPPALKEATFYEGGIVSVESVKRMSEIIAEQARVYAATIRNGIRTPIVVEDEPVEENTDEDIFDVYEETPVEENDTEIYEEEPAEDTSLFDEPVEEVEPETFEEPTFETPSFEEPTFEEPSFEDTMGIETEAEAEEEEVVETESATDANTVFVPMTSADAIPEGADVVGVPVYGAAIDPTAPVTFEEMGGFGGMTMPVAPVADEDSPFAMPAMGESLPELPTVEENLFADAEPVVEEEEQPVLMENVEPLHKVEEEEEDPRNKEQFKSIADFLNTL